VSGYKVQAAAGDRLDEICRYSVDHWGEAQAEPYVRGLFERFEAIAERRFPWRAIPADLGVDGYVCRYEKHLVYWKVFGDGAVGIVTILHERMHPPSRLKTDFGD
jgi:toxin ParE1/3/4